MKPNVIILLIAILSATSTLPTRAEEKPVALGVDTLAAKPADYAGKPLHLTGIVHRVSAERRMVVLIDLNEANCTDACSPATVLVKFSETGNLPAAKERVLVKGKIHGDAKPVTLQATKWLPANEAKPAS